jgi:hypothetical protein
VLLGIPERYFPSCDALDGAQAERRTSARWTVLLGPHQQRPDPPGRADSPSNEVRSRFRAESPRSSRLQRPARTHRTHRWFNSAECGERPSDNTTGRGTTAGTVRAVSYLRGRLDDEVHRARAQQQTEQARQEAEDARREASSHASAQHLTRLQGLICQRVRSDARDAAAYLQERGYSPPYSVSIGASGVERRAWVLRYSFTQELHQPVDPERLGGTPKWVRHYRGIAVDEGGELVLFGGQPRWPAGAHVLIGSGSANDDTVTPLARIEKDRADPNDQALVRMWSELFVKLVTETVTHGRYVPPCQQVQSAWVGSNADAGTPSPLSQPVEPASQAATAARAAEIAYESACEAWVRTVIPLLHDGHPFAQLAQVIRAATIQGPDLDEAETYDPDLVRRVLPGASFPWDDDMVAAWFAGACRQPAERLRGPSKKTAFGWKQTFIAGWVFPASAVTINSRGYFTKVASPTGISQRGGKLYPSQGGGVVSPTPVDDIRFGGRAFAAMADMAQLPELPSAPRRVRVRETS